MGLARTIFFASVFVSTIALVTLAVSDWIYGRGK